MIFQKLFSYSFDSESTESSILSTKPNIIDSPYQTTIEMESTNIFYFFYTLLFIKIEIIQLLIYPKKFELLTISLSLYLLSLLTDFTMNALLFSDDVISQKYHNKGNILTLLLQCH